MNSANEGKKWFSSIIAVITTAVAVGSLYYSHIQADVARQSLEVTRGEKSDKAENQTGQPAKTSAGPLPSGKVTEVLRQPASPHTKVADEQFNHPGEGQGRERAELQKKLAELESQVLLWKERHAVEKKERREAEATWKDLLAHEQRNKQEAETQLATLQYDQAKERKGWQEAVTAWKDLLAKEQRRREQLEGQLAALNKRQAIPIGNTRSEKTPRKRTYYSGVTRNGGDPIPRD